MLRRSALVTGRTLQRMSAVPASRPLLSANVLRPSIRSLATSPKAQQHCSKLSNIDKSTTPSAAAAPAIDTSPKPQPTPAAASTVSTPSSFTAATSPSPTSPAAARASALPSSPRSGPPVTSARRLPPSAPQSLSPPPSKEPLFPPDSIMARRWHQFAWVWKTTVQFLLVFGWTLVATRIILTPYPARVLGTQQEEARHSRYHDRIACRNSG